MSDGTIVSAQAVSAKVFIWHTVSEMELSRMPDARVTGVWMDPTATHALVSVTVGSALGSTTELHYVHAKWKKPRVLSKVKQKGVRITAVAWSSSNLSETSSGYESFCVCALEECSVRERPHRKHCLVLQKQAKKSLDPAEADYFVAPHCRPVILGTDKGKLLEISLEEKDKKDGPVKELYNFEDVPEPIRGIEQQDLSGDRLLLLVATPSRLYVFVGGPTSDALFASYPDSAGRGNLAI